MTMGGLKLSSPSLNLATAVLIFFMSSHVKSATTNNKTTYEVTGLIAVKLISTAIHLHFRNGFPNTQINLFPSSHIRSRKKDRFLGDRKHSKRFHHAYITHRDEQFTLYFLTKGGLSSTMAAIVRRPADPSKHSGILGTCLSTTPIA